jgi:hypothetical protein
LLARDPAVATQDIDFIGDKTKDLLRLSEVAGKNRSGDRKDIRTLCDRAELDIETLRKRYRLARQFYDYDEREKLDKNFQLVEVEFLGEQPTRFD